MIRLLNRLSNNTIAKSWRGYGSSIFFELKNSSSSIVDEKYDYTIMLGANWRILQMDNFIISSIFHKNEIDTFLTSLVGLKTSKVKFIKHLGEIVVHVEQYKIITFGLQEKPEWVIFDRGQNICYCLGENGFVQPEQNLNANTLEI